MLQQQHHDMSGNGYTSVYQPVGRGPLLTIHGLLRVMSSLGNKF
jgi:hypothetical protein